MAQVGDRSCLSCESLQRVRVIQVPCADSLDRHERPAVAAFARYTAAIPPCPSSRIELVVVLECAKVHREIGLGLHRLAVELPPDQCRMRARTSRLTPYPERRDRRGGAAPNVAPEETSARHTRGFARCTSHRPSWASASVLAIRTVPPPRRASTIQRSGHCGPLVPRPPCQSAFNAGGPRCALVPVVLACG